MKLISTQSRNNVTVRVYRDSEWNQYVCKAAVGGIVEDEEQWAVEDDKVAALRIAGYMLNALT